MGTQDGALHAGSEIVVMAAAEYGAVRQDSLRDRVLEWREVDALESSVTAPQEAVKVHGGLARHFVRPNDLAVDADAQSYGEDRAWKIDGCEFVVAEHEAMGARRVVVRSDDLPPVIDSPCYRAPRSGNFDGPERKTTLDGSESCYRRW